MKLLKILFSILLLFIVVIALAIGCLIYFVDPNQLKPVLIKEVKKETGYQLQIDGRLSWAFYPSVSVKIDHMLLSAPNKSTPFVEASDIRIATDLFALLQSREKLKGNILISTMKLMNVQADNVSAALHWENNILTITPIKASLYEGTLEGVIIGKEFSTLPHWKWKVQANNIQVKPLLLDANGSDSKIKIDGVAQLKLQAETHGIGREQILNNLNGTSSFSLNKGLVDGIDINYFVKTAEALLNKDPVSVPENSHQTMFDRMTGTVLIQEGVARTEDLAFVSSAFSAKAQGSVVLLSSALDLQLQVRPVLENSKKQWEIPILMTGNLHHPDIRLDMMKIQKLLAGLQIEKVKQEAIKQIKKHVHGKTGEILQKLLGN